MYIQNNKPNNHQMQWTNPIASTCNSLPMSQAEHPSLARTQNHLEVPIAFDDAPKIQERTVANSQTIVQAELPSVTKTQTGHIEAITFFDETETQEWTSANPQAISQAELPSDTKTQIGHIEAITFCDETETQERTSANPQTVAQAELPSDTKTQIGHIEPITFCDEPKIQKLTAGPMYKPSSLAQAELPSTEKEPYWPIDTMNDFFDEEQIESSDSWICYNDQDTDGFISSITDFPDMEKGYFDKIDPPMKNTLPTGQVNSSAVSKALEEKVVPDSSLSQKVTHYQELDLQDANRQIHQFLSVSQPDGPQASQESESLSVNALGRSLKHDVSIYKEKLTPISLGEKVKNAFTFFTLNHEIYLYQNGCYNLISQLDMETEILKKFKKEVEQTGSTQIVNSAYKYLTMDSKLKIEGLIETQNMVPFKNGLFNLDTWKFIASSPSYFNTFTLNCPYPIYSAVAYCPEFERFLQVMSGGDNLLMTRVWEFLGYSLTQDVNGKAIFVLQGVTGSGKSVLANLLKAFYPSSVQTALDAHEMSEKFAMGEFEGRMLCISSDMSAEPLNGKTVSNLKKLTGRDTVNSDIKHAKRTDFVFTGKVVLVTNNPLILRNPDLAFVDRIVAIPFRYHVPPEQRIYDLEAKLTIEMPNIAAKALNAYANLRQNRYRFSGDFQINDPTLYPSLDTETSCEAMIEKYLICHYEPCAEGIVFMDDIYLDFAQLCHVSISKNKFSNIFNDYAKQLYKADKIRTRKEGQQNPISAIKGIRRKQKEVPLF